VLGEHELNVGGFHARRQYPRQIVVYNNPIDIHPHNPTAQGYVNFQKDFEAKMKPGGSVGLPYGMTAPKGCKNLWVSGRCGGEVSPHEAACGGDRCRGLGGHIAEGGSVPAANRDEQDDDSR
jgi:hypothetical protein